ncbi:MAG: glycosyl transferase family 4 [Candidatus Diapherotrites archaeon]|uniref:Glycosyl transferase family 4 n=1 Tax=Candidatus Iainarchaeum sp. TaxID=3101447 RepID=A0A8T4LDH0_9ARCH|nr:glycosyl transferase family 4 [Candidatus Diapherotrites archaeon]
MIEWIGILSVARYLVIAFFAFLITYLATPKIIDRMKSQGFIAPDMNKLSKPGVAELGGTAIFFGFAAATMLAIFWHSFVSEFQVDLTLLLAGFSTIVLIGFIGIFDDIIGWKKGIRQYQHALFPIFAALPLMAVKAGVTVISVPFIGPVDFGIAYALVLIPLGVTGAANASNMLAGLNGLEAGLGTVLTATMLILSVLTNQVEAAIISAAILGALLGFLRFNWFPAKVFPGDATTLMVGASVATASILGNMEKLGLLLFALYFFELILKARKKFQGESFGQPQTDGTLSPPKETISLTHLIMKQGRFSEKKVVLILIGLQIVVALAVLIYYYLNSIHFFSPWLSGI